MWIINQVINFLIFILIVVIKTGAFACLQTALVLDRGLGYFVSRKYVPSFIIVSTSFIGFWIPSHSYPARVTLIVTSLLSLITQQVQTVHIYASYIISIHIWNNICTTFVFLGLIEFIIATCWDTNNINQTVRLIDWLIELNVYPLTVKLIVKVLIVLLCIYLFLLRKRPVNLWKVEEGVMSIDLHVS